MEDKLTVLATIGNSKRYPSSKNNASMVVTVITEVNSRPSLRYKILKSHIVEIGRMEAVCDNRVVFTFGCGIGIDLGIKLVAKEMIEHDDSPYLESIVCTNTAPTDGSYIRLDGAKGAHVAYGESQDYILDGKPLQLLTRELEESIWIK